MILIDQKPSNFRNSISSCFLFIIQLKNSCYLLYNDTVLIFLIYFKIGFETMSLSLYGKF